MRIQTLWSKTEDTLMQQLIKDGFTASEIATRLPGNRSRNSVIGRSHRMRMRLNPNKGGHGKNAITWLFGNRNNLWMASEDAILRNNWASMGANQEGVLLGRTFRAIQQRATKLGIRVRRELVRTYKWRDSNHRNIIFQPAPDHGCKTLMEVGNNECRFGYGDPLKLDEFRFCGNPTNGTSWCPAHSHIVFNMEKR